MSKLIIASCVVVIFLVVSGCDSISRIYPTSPSSTNSLGNQNEVSNIEETTGNILAIHGITQTINGVELSTIRGWLANIYPWEYDPKQSTVHPVARLWTP